MENFGKNANIRGRWEYVSLTKEEIEKALDELMKSNYEQIRKIQLMTNDMETIKMLVDKNLLAAYTYLSSKLDEKVENMKNPKPTKATQDLTQHPMYKKAEEYAERKLKEREQKLSGPSLIDEAMKDIDK